MEPMAVFSFAGYGRFVQDLDLLSTAGRNEGLPGQVRRFLGSLSGLESLQGIAKDRPVGVVIATDGLEVVPFLAFIPVTDRDALFKSIAKVTGQPQPSGEGTWKIGQRELTAYLRQRGDWLYMAQTERNLSWLPDPAKVLGRLPERYDFAIEFNLQRVPDVFRVFAIDLLRLAMRDRLSRREGESEAAHALRYRIGTWEYGTIEQVLTECEKVTLGWTLDEKTKQARLDLVLKPLAGTKLAGRTEALKHSGSRFADLAGEESPLRFHVTLTLGEEQARKAGDELAFVRRMLPPLVREAESLQSEEDRQAALGLCETLADVVEATIRTRRVDFGFAALGEKPPLTLLAAAHLGDGTILHGTFERVAELGNRDKRFAGFRTDAAKIGEHRVHAVLFSGSSAAALTRLFGQEPRLYVTFTRDTLWLAAGPQALAALERKLASGGTAPSRKEPVASLQLNLRLSKLIDAVDRLIDQGAERQAIALLRLQLRGTDDRLSVTVAGTDEGLHVQCVGQEGVVRLVALGVGLQLLLGG
jgi:hypothetical protein